MKLFQAFFVLTVLFGSYYSQAVASDLLTVQGDATIQKPADMFSLQLGVMTEAALIDQAMKESSEKMEEVIAAVEKLGLSKQEYQTGSYHILPRYSARPSNAPPSWKTSIIGYQITNKILIKTTKIESVGQLIERVVAAGANTVDNLQFSLSNPQQFREEVIAEATANAIADATALARSANVALKKVSNISLDQAYLTPFQSKRDGLLLLAQQQATPPIEGGQVSLSARVTIQFEITQD